MTVLPHPAATTTRVVAVVCVVLGGLFASYLFLQIYMTLTRGLVYPFGDFFAIWSYPKIAISQSTATLYDFDRLHDAQVALGMNPSEHNPFPYPPTFLLMLWPLGLLSYWPALIAWLALTFALYAAATLVGSFSLLPRLALVLALAPTTAITVVAGQSGFLAAALLIGGLRLTDRRPVLGGILLGLLTYKPQLGLLVPVALIAAGQWRCIAAACATTAILAAFATAMFGPPIWQIWLDSLPLYQERFGQAIANSRLMPTMLADLQSLGIPLAEANLAQGLAALLAACVVWVCFRRGPRPLAIAVLPACCALTTPHALIYDLPMLTGGAVLFIADRMRSASAFTIPELAALVCVLVFPALMANSSFHLPIASAVLVLFVAVILRRRRRDVSATFWIERKEGLLF